MKRAAVLFSGILVFGLMLVLACAVFFSPTAGDIGGNAEVPAEDGGSPIIFVPGVMGSNLYLPDDGRLIWYSLYSAVMYPKYLNISYDLTVRHNDEDQAALSVFEREYGVNGMYTSVMNRLCAEFAGRPVYFFSYDFRKSCEESAVRLYEEIELVKEATGASEVSIVCHSMGGVVVSSYAERYGSSSLDRVVVLGAPFEGAPDALYSAYAGGLFGFPSGVVTPVTGLTAGTISRYPGITAMYPTEAYLAAVSMMINGSVMSEGEYQQMVAELCGGISARTAGDDILAELSNTYFAVGVGERTVVSLSFDGAGGVSPVVRRAGDGTVPYDSATMFGRLTMLLPDEDGVSRYREFSTSHNGLLGDAASLEWICEVLRDGR